MTSIAAEDWYGWKERLWDAMAERYGYPGLAHMEQVVLRSKKETRCAECGAPGTVRHDSSLIKSVSHYFVCDECHAYYEAKS